MMCSWNQMYDSAVVPEPGGPGGPDLELKNEIDKKH